MIGISEAELIAMENRARDLQQIAHRSATAIQRDGGIQYFDREDKERSVADDLLTLIELCRRAGFSLGH